MTEVCHSPRGGRTLLSAAPVLPLAHSGHWLVNLMYLAPVVGFAGWLGVVTWRERREGSASERQQPRRTPKEK